MAQSKVQQLAESLSLLVELNRNLEHASFESSLHLVARARCTFVGDHAARALGTMLNLKAPTHRVGEHIDLIAVAAVIAIVDKVRARH